jgi:hypothetical protein
MNTEQIRAALNEKEQSLRTAVGHTKWQSSTGILPIGTMDEDHLINSAIYAQRKADDIARLNLKFVPKYFGRTWEDWVTLFRAELEYRHSEEGLAEVPW